MKALDHANTPCQVLCPYEVRAAERSDGVYKLKYTTASVLAYIHDDTHVSTAVLGRFSSTMSLAYSNMLLLVICPSEACVANVWRWCIERYHFIYVSCDFDKLLGRSSPLQLLVTAMPSKRVLRY